ncbi:major facilitator superfamily transporter [Aspergillus luchuensis IFO 4308]|nr:major facilitator superfamily transporter [Aspergillus luchuensis IFO 4308]
MRILCLHGAGTNSRIFEIQTAAIRYELGDNHIYDFVEGTVPSKMQPGIDVVAWKDEPVYAYFDEHNPQTGFAAYHYLEEYLLEEGPYDGVIAFSQAGTMILTYLIHLAKQNPRAEMPFKFAIILSITHPPLDYEALQKGRVMTVDLEATKGIIPIPTAHIWGSLDEPASQVATSNSVCKAEVRWVVALGLFLATAEITVISTSLVTISEHLEGGDQSSWVITSYLLTYTGFLAPWSKCALAFGLKPTLLSSLLLFIAFSGGCGAAQSIDQLIICRTFQGIGGSGLFALGLYTLLRIVPPNRFEVANAVGSGVLTFALILGSLIGGGISSSSSWRWVFLFNVPAGGWAWIMLCLFFPKNFPRGLTSRSAQSKLHQYLTQADLLGYLLLLGFSLLLVAALEEANVRYAWSSGIIIGCLTGSGVLLAAFLAWEWILSGRKHVRIEPMLPWRLFKSRVVLGIIMLVDTSPLRPIMVISYGFFSTGPAITILYIELPQRFQTVNNFTPIEAGLRVLAFGVGSPAGAFCCSVLAGRLRTPFVHLTLAGSVLQIVGAFLLSSVPPTVNAWPGEYGYMVVTGLGTGISIAALYMAVPLVVRHREQAIVMGLTLQARMLGASLGIAIVNSILTNYVKGHLAPAEAAADPNHLTGLPMSVQETIRTAYAHGYNRQMYAVGACGVVQLFGVALMWKKDQVRFDPQAKTSWVYDHETDQNSGNLNGSTE